MEAAPVVTTIPQAQSSVELVRYKDGTYGWTTKRYTGSELPDLEEINLYDDELKRRFMGPAPERGTP